MVAEATNIYKTVRMFVTKTVIDELIALGEETEGFEVTHPCYIKTFCCSNHRYSTIRRYGFCKIGLFGVVFSYLSWIHRTFREKNRREDAFIYSFVKWMTMENVLKENKLELSLSNGFVSHSICSGSYKHYLQEYFSLSVSQEFKQVLFAHKLWVCHRVHSLTRRSKNKNEQTQSMLFA